MNNPWILTTRIKKERRKLERRIGRPLEQHELEKLWTESETLTRLEAINRQAESAKYRLRISVCLLALSTAAIAAGFVVRTDDIRFQLTGSTETLELVTNAGTLFPSSLVASSFSGSFTPAATATLLSQSDVTPRAADLSGPASAVRVRCGLHKTRPARARISALRLASPARLRLELRAPGPQLAIAVAIAPLDNRSISLADTTILAGSAGSDCMAEVAYRGAPIRRSGPLSVTVQGKPRGRFDAVLATSAHVPIFKGKITGEVEFARSGANRGAALIEVTRFEDLAKGTLTFPDLNRSQYVAGGRHVALEVRGSTVVNVSIKDNQLRFTIDGRLRSLAVEGANQMPTLVEVLSRHSQLGLFAGAVLWMFGLTSYFVRTLTG